MSGSGMSPEFEKKLEALAKDLHERGAIIPRNPNAERLPFAPYVEEGETNVAKTMAEVLAEHMLVDDDACDCNEMFYDTRLTPGQIAHEHSLHVEMELHNAGYGLVVDAKREAWDEGHESGFWNGRLSHGDPEALTGIEHAQLSNPYRKASNDDQ